MTALFRGAEDIHFSPIGVPSVDNTAGHWRNGYARCALKSLNTASQAGTDGPNQVLNNGWRIPSSYGIVAGNFWFTARVYSDGNDTSGASGQFWNALSAGDVARLQLRRPGSGISRGSLDFNLVKLDNAGTATLLASSSGAVAFQAVTKIDIHLNYATNGFFRLYGDGDLLLSYTGDVTTNGVTSLTGIDMGSWGITGSFTSWSEVIWDTTDTRSMGLVTIAPNAVGSLDQWTGTFTDINQITNTDLSFNSTPTSGEVQLYNNTQLPVGEFSIVDFTSTARGVSSGSPATYDFELITHATVFDSPTQTPAASLGLQYYTWTLNPFTGNPWTISEINVIQQGMKSLISGASYGPYVYDSKQQRQR